MKDRKYSGYASIDLPQNRGYSFTASHPVIPNLSIYNGIKLLTLMHPEKIAVECLELQVSYRQMFADAVTVSRAMKALGIRTGDIVSICIDIVLSCIGNQAAKRF